MKRIIEGIYEKNKNIDFLDNNHVTMQRQSQLPIIELNHTLELVDTNTMGDDSF